MANLTDTAGCGCNGSTGTTSVLLPASPFYAPRYHFGMLLGVDDFESEQAYHRGKGRLHNAWLHGEGVVWGFGVDLPEIEGRPGVPRGEIRVRPGFALDAAGRELHLDCDACVSIAAWYAAHRDDPEVVAAVRVGANGVVRLDAHVVARFRACPARPVPSISEPCNGSGGDVAYSRTQETAELLLLPGAAPPRTMPYHRLRLLFALEGPRLDRDGNVTLGDQEVLDARDAVLALAPEDQPAAYLEAFRHFAAFDEMDLRPAALPEGGGTTLFPADDSCVVVLADVIQITLRPVTGGDPDELEFAQAVVDNTVRPSHVATSTIQELLCGPLATCLCPPAGSPPGSPPAGSPPVDESPPVESPPAESPPVESPPVESPPVESPPVESPPVESPPVESPPEESPPVESPPVESPPAESPPVESPPVESPPVESPPVESPPSSPPVDEVPPVQPGETFAPGGGTRPEPPVSSAPAQPPTDEPGEPLDGPPPAEEWNPPTLRTRDTIAADFEAFPAAEAEDAGGPRIDPKSIQLEGEAVLLAANKRLSKASVAPTAFSVSAYDLRDGWHDVEVRATRLDTAQRKVRLELATGFGGNLVRIIARGTGPSPLLGTDLVPLAGETGGPPGGADNGHDFVIMLKRSET